MARNWTLQWEAPEVTLPTSAFAEFSTQNNRPVNAFDASTDESVILEGIIPAEHTGSGTLKLRILAMANTTTAADDARIDITGECITPDNNESGNSDSFSSADSGTFTFSTTAYAIMALTVTLANFKSGESPTAGDKFRVKVTRDADNGSGLDSLAVDLLVLGYELYEEA